MTYGGTTWTFVVKVACISVYSKLDLSEKLCLFILYYLFILYIRHCLVLAHTIMDTEPLLGHWSKSNY